LKYAVVIHHAEEGGYWAEVPALPGCFAQGDTLEEVIADMQEAIESHIEALRDDGQSIPIDDVLPDMAIVEVPA
jgi:predicted RNase H-like HicB family nuclease